MEQPRRFRRVVLTLLALAVLATALAIAMRPRASGEADLGHARPIPGADGERVVVEVLNASGRVGLARAATRRLRDAGLDVVYFGTDEQDDLDTTLVVLRRGERSSAARVADALGVGAVQAAPDAGRLVDVTVRLGRDFSRLALVSEP